MSQYGFPDLESPVSGEELINTHLEPTFAALYSSHSGASRPSYAVAGTIWLDTTTTPWLLKMFNGTANDITLGSIDPAAFTFSPRGVTQWGGSAGGTANALTLTPTIPLTAYAAGVAYECLITATNTSETVTVNISGIGARTVKCSVGAGKVNPPIGVLQNGMIARFVDDGTNLILLNVRPYNKSADIATSGTVVLDNASGDYVTLTGTTTVTAITLAEGVEKTVKAGGAFQFTHGASLVMPGGSNYVCQANDVFKFRGESSGVVRCIAITRESGTARTNMLFTETTTSDSTTTTVPYDNTIPQNTEGKEFTALNTAFTPKYANSKIEIEVFIPMIDTNANNIWIGFLCQSGVANALAVATHTAAGVNSPCMFYLKTVVDAANITARTYSLRFGPQAGTAYLNRPQAAAAQFGGAAKAYMKVTEIIQ